jgi:hypothetical protein
MAQSFFFAVSSGIGSAIAVYALGVGVDIAFGTWFGSVVTFIGFKSGFLP